MKKYLYKSLMEHKINFIFIAILFTILTMFVSTIAFVFTSSFDTSEKYYNNVNAETYRFMNYSPKKEDYDNIILDLNEKYKTEFEYVEYKLYSDDKNIFEVYPLEEQKSINLLTLLEGKYPRNNNEVLISSKYAETNNVKIGTQMNVDGNKIDVVGIVDDPNFVMAMPESSLVPNYSTFAGIYVTTDAYENLKYNANSYLITNDDNIDEISAENIITNTYTGKEEAFSGYVPFLKNQRVGGYTIQMQKEFSALLQITILIFIAILVLTFMLLKQIFKENKKDIGIFRAEGYSDKHMKKIFIKNLLFLIIPSIIIGIGGSVLLSTSLINLNDANLSLMTNIKIENVGISLICIVFTIIIYMIIVKFLIIDKVFKMNILNQIHKREDKKNIKKRKKITKNISKRLMILNLKSSLLIYIISFVTTIALVILVALVYTVNKMNDESFFQTSTNFDYVIKSSASTDKDETGYFLPVEVNNVDAQLYSFQSDTQKIKYKLNENEVVISPALAHNLNKKVGDMISTTFGKYDVQYKIVAISNDNVGDTIYSNLEYTNQEIDKEKTTHNSIFTNDISKYSDIDKNMYTDMKSAQSSMETQMIMLKGIVIFLIIFVCITTIMSIVFILSLMIRNYKNDISILKVIGYKKNQVLKMYFSPHLIVVLITVIFGVVVTLPILSNLKFFATADYAIVLPVENYIMYMCITFVIMILIIFISAIYIKSKLNKIDIKSTLNEE